MNNADKIKLIERLRHDYDHAFLSEAGCREFLDPFGITGGVETWNANPHDMKGLTLNDGAQSAKGNDAANIAEMIANELGCKYFQAMGRGSRLRFACDAIIAKLQENVK